MKNIDKDILKLLKEKLYHLYDDQLRMCDFDLKTDLIDRKINKLEIYIEGLQMEMYD